MINDMLLCPEQKDNISTHTFKQIENISNSTRAHTHTHVHAHTLCTFTDNNTAFSFHWKNRENFLLITEHRETVQCRQNVMSKLNIKLTR